MPVSQHLLLAPLEGPLGPSTNTPRIKTRSMCVDPFYFSNEVWLEKWCAFHCSCTSTLKIIIQCEIATKSPAFVSALQYIFISVEALNSGRGFKYLLSLSLSPTQWAPSVTEPLTVQTNTSPSCSVSIKTACCGWRDSRGLQKMQSWRQIIIIRHSKQSDTLQRAPQVFHFHTCSWREITRNVWNDRHQQCTWQKAFEPTIMCSFDNELFKSLYKPFWKSRWRLVDFLFSTTLLLSDCWWLQFSLSIFQSSPEVWDHHSCWTGVCWRVRTPMPVCSFRCCSLFNHELCIKMDMMWSRSIFTPPGGRLQYR